jgi:hypothetical protein
MNDPRLSQVTFENGVLHVGDVAFTQFADYKASTFRPPPKWPAGAEVVIEAKVDRPKRALVSAAVLDEATAQDWTVERVLGEPEKTLYGSRAVKELADDTVKGGERECRYRIKEGAIDDQGGTRASGVIVVSTRGRPSTGVLVDGFQADEVQRLTVDMAKALCAGEPSGA